MNFLELSDYVLAGNVEKVVEGTKWRIQQGVEPL